MEIWLLGAADAEAAITDAIKATVQITAFRIAPKVLIASADL
jgi:hypothetical protein